MDYWQAKLTHTAGFHAVTGPGLEVPGDYVMVDHSIFRIDRGALGMINIAGDPGPQIFHPHDSSKGSQ